MCGWQGRGISSPIRRNPLKANRSVPRAALACALLSHFAPGQTPSGPVAVTLDQAIQTALQHNNSLLAARTTVHQSQAQEIPANLRPTPTLFTDWEYLPLVNPGGSLLDYLHNSTEGDIGLSYLRSEEHTSESSHLVIS